MYGRSAHLLNRMLDSGLDINRMVCKARIAQLVEHRTENPGVRSSILRPGICLS